MKYLKLLIVNGDCLYLFFYGLLGVGKKMFVFGVLCEIFGLGVEKVKLENKMWKID